MTKAANGEKRRHCDRRRAGEGDGSALELLTQTSWTFMATFSARGRVPVVHALNVLDDPAYLSAEPSRYIRPVRF